MYRLSSVPVRWSGFYVEGGELDLFSATFSLRLITFSSITSPDLSIGLDFNFFAVDVYPRNVPRT